MLRRFCLVTVLLCACDGEMPAAEDAAVDALAIDAGTDGVPPIDAPPAPEPSCTPGATTPPSPGAHTPVAGTYCTAWTHQDGVIDSFARYYDRVDIVLAGSPGARWWASDSAGQKEYVAGGGVMNGCFVVDQFVSNDGVSGSGDIYLCWSSETEASGAMAWCSSTLDAHWTVALSACP